MLYCLIGFVGISLVGTLLHFVYDWLKHNKICSPILAVNESTWEHLKLAVIPCLLWAIVGLFLNINNLFFGVLISIVAICVVIPLIFYTYTHFTKKPILAIDIASFFVAIAIGMLLANIIFSSAELPSIVKIFSIIGNVIVLAMFVVFTFYPPKIFLFRDPISKKYGIKGHYDDSKYGNYYTLKK